jgi:hypothetical protein
VSEIKQRGLGGWTRLWLAISIVFFIGAIGAAVSTRDYQGNLETANCVPGTLKVIDPIPDSERSKYIENSQEGIGTSNTTSDQNAFGGWKPKDLLSTERRDLLANVPPPPSLNSCTTFSRLFFLFFLAVLGSGSLWMFGWLFSWVRRGFKNAQTH